MMIRNLTVYAEWQAVINDVAGPGRILAFTFPGGEFYVAAMVPSSGIYTVVEGRFASKPASFDVDYGPYVTYLTTQPEFVI